MKLALKILLAPTALLVSLPGALAFAQCVRPDQYANVTSSVAGDLRFIMGTDRFTYEVGDSVFFYLSVYNSGSGTVVIPNPGQVSAIHSWDVLPDTCLSRYEPEGCQSNSPFGWPQGVFFFGVPLPVAPGECRTFTTTWNGVHQFSITGRTVTPDVYRVVGGFLVGWNAQTSQGALIEPMEVQIRITDGVPVSQSTWGAVKAGRAW